ncbi:MAG: metallophosphoesterase [Lachnospiraceae bacterium]|nr:metallophosphoesterase [Lachnospiraceae bacterium]
MIYVTGDIHGDLKRFSKKWFPEQKEMSRDDYMIILGDFGVIWDRKESEEEKYNLDILANRSYTTLFIDGNHENHDRLASFPVKEWHGGMVHEIRTNVLHLMRAQIYTIDGKTFFTFGGAASHDIAGCADKEELKKDYTAGVLRRDDPDFLNKIRHCKRYLLCYRIEGESWWRREMPSGEEMEAGRKKLESAGWKVDYVLTHEGPSSTLDELSDGAIPPDRLSEYLESLKQRLQYKTWYFGHHHDDLTVTERDILLYTNIVQIDD